MSADIQRMRDLHSEMDRTPKEPCYPAVLRNRVSSRLDWAETRLRMRRSREISV